MRLIDRKVFGEFILYGDLHRFIPIFASLQGFRVSEVKVSQSEEDTKIRVIRPGAYLRRFIDILSLFFIAKFTKKPLRFFGLVGSALFIPGFMMTLALGILRLMGVFSLANRPLLLLGVILMVFGIHTLSIGMVGELIIFSHAKDIKDYYIDEIIG
jgi:hypothetical protein